MTAKDIVDLNFNSKVARKLLALYYRKGRTYKIPFGPLRGKKMVYDPGMVFHNILGLTDLNMFRALKKVFSVCPRLNGEGVAVDLGANRGVYSLWLAGTKCFKKVYCFEPNPSLIGQLRTNAALNCFESIEVFPGACADRVGEMELFFGDNDFCSSLLGKSNQTKILVKTTSLDDFFHGDSERAKERGPSFIKMDIEGGGIFALPGAVKCIERNRPLLCLESHSPEEDRTIGEVLRTFDYQAVRPSEREWVEDVDETAPNSRGVWGNLVACPTEQQDKIAEALRVRPKRWVSARKKLCTSAAKFHEVSASSPGAEPVAVDSFGLSSSDRWSPVSPQLPSSPTPPPA